MKFSEYIRALLRQEIEDLREQLAQTEPDTLDAEALQRQIARMEANLAAVRQPPLERYYVWTKPQRQPRERATREEFLVVIAALPTLLE